LKALGLVALLVAFGATLQGLSQATSLTTPDSTTDATGGTSPVKVDLGSVSHADSGTAITYTAHTVGVVTPSDIVSIKWHLDMNNNTVFDETAGDACITVAQGGPTGLIASLKPTCGSQTLLGTADVTTTPASGGDDLTFSFDNAQFRTFTSFSGSTYNYFVNSVDVNGNADRVPDTGFITHSGVVAAATATPTAAPTATPVPTPVPGSTTASTTQSQQVSVAGVLSISRLLPLVDFGGINTSASKSNVDAGELDYTNTLDNSFAWNVAVQTTNLTRSGTAPQPAIAYANETFTPGTAITSGSGSTNAPTVGSASQGAFAGSGATSNPITVAQASSGTYGTGAFGSYQQTGSKLALTVPLGTRPGTYTGTLTYTITG
jgi:hypothetical protein